jgi:hypothetical protein
MAWSAAKLNDPAVTDGRGKSIKELAVERLARQLAGDLVGVVGGDAVVRLPRVGRAEPVVAGWIAQPPPPTGPVGRL